MRTTIACKGGKKIGNKNEAKQYKSRSIYGQTHHLTCDGSPPILDAPPAAQQMNVHAPGHAETGAKAEA
jgi:hypothetical protein